MHVRVCVRVCARMTARVRVCVSMLSLKVPLLLVLPLAGVEEG
jgi:hypothetical protein